MRTDFNSHIDSVLTCPVCKKKLEADKSKLFCSNCNLSYQKIDGILDLIPHGLYESEPYTKYPSKDQLNFLFNRRVFGSLADSFMHDVFLNQIKNLPKDSIILELGCGRGMDSYKLLKDGYHLVVSDVFSEIIKRVKTMLEETKVSESAYFCLINAEILPFAENSFDLIYMVSSLHHLKDPSEALFEIQRCLKPKGVFILAIEPNFLINFIVMKFFKTIRVIKSSFWRIGKKKQTFSDDERPGFSKNEILKLIQRASLKPVSIKPLWYLNGFIQICFLDLLQNNFYQDRNLQLSKKTEKLFIKFDNLISKIPFLQKLCWFWTVKAVKD